MNRLIKRHLRKIKSYTPGKPIEEVQRELGLKKVIKLASNENALPPSRKVISSVIRSLKNINRYPDSECFYLKKELAGRFRLKPENFIIGNGSDEVITFAVRAFLNGDEEAIVAKPTFLIYAIAAGIEKGRIRYVPLREFRYDLKAMKKAITRKTKVIFIANPDNPTGTYVTRNEVEDFMSGMRRDIIVFFDEAYYEFAKRRRDYPDTVRFLEGRNVIVTRSFSKIYSLAGLRIGYGVANEELIEGMNKVREPFNVNSLAQAAALASLRDDRIPQRAVRAVEEGMKFLTGQLDLLGVRYIPSAANFLLFETGPEADRIYGALLKRGVIIRNMKNWGLKGFLRVTVGTMRENRVFIKKLKGVL